MSRGRIKGQKVGPYFKQSKYPSFQRLRLEAGLTQEQLAKLAGISPRTVRNFDRWGSTNSPECDAALAILGKRVTAGLFEDCPTKARAVALANKTGTAGASA